ncbi:hypothetical protein CO726_29210 [Bacillus fungorum]|uniref:Ribosomal protein L7/L12 C-terminal domain-containing protein n=1 Tax=Bacillus fungorum TaxID=2039284 RepID=A0A2G6Q566_9BACI|nr:hypothetical protein [Bacillus fungorum]PIE91952.1 hypothetical protein CO726_29210 [Bacillus fungorum]
MSFVSFSLIFNIVFIIYIIILTTKINVLRNENIKLLKETNAFDDLKTEVKQKLELSTEMETIKFLRTKKGLSIIDAKQIVDSVKNNK